MKLTLSIKRAIVTVPVKANLEDVKLELDDVGVEDVAALAHFFAEKEEETTTLEDILKSSPFGGPSPFQNPSQFFGGPMFKTVASIDPKDIMSVLKNVGKDIGAGGDKPFNLQEFLSDEMKNMKKKE